MSCSVTWLLASKASGPVHVPVLGALSRSLSLCLNCPPPEVSTAMISSSDPVDYNPVALRIIKDRGGSSSGRVWRRVNKQTARRPVSCSEAAAPRRTLVWWLFLFAFAVMSCEICPYRPTGPIPTLRPRWHHGFALSSPFSTLRMRFPLATSPPSSDSSSSDSSPLT